MKKTIIALITVLLFAPTSNALAFSFAGPRDNWTPLSAARLNQLPPAIKRTLLAAQRACGDETIRVKTGYLRFLPAVHGAAFVALHLDQVHCSNRAALCRAEDCLHKVYVAGRPRDAREVWRGYVRETGLDRDAGAVALTIDCGDACETTMRWNGRQFGH